MPTLEGSLAGKFNRVRLFGLHAAFSDRSTGLNAYVLRVTVVLRVAVLLRVTVVFPVLRV
jgi:hypothetical protein